MDDNLLECDGCKNEFVIHEMKIFSDDIEEECNRVVHLNCFCKDCYEKYMTKIKQNGTSIR